MIDAYTHCGISKFLPVENVLSAMSSAGVSRAVLCQHLGEYDNSYIEHVVLARPEQFTGVALVDHEDDNWRESLARVARSSAFGGIRTVAETLALRPEIALEASLLGLVIVVYAADGIADAVSPIRQLLETNPAAVIEVTHLGNPKVEAEELIAGFELLDLADEPGVVVTLSGLPMFCDYPYQPLDELIVASIDAFGPHRLLWGSNYPVAGPEPSHFQRELDLIRAGHWGLDASAVEAITSRNAERVWFSGP